MTPEEIKEITDSVQNGFIDVLEELKKIKEETKNNPVPADRVKELRTTNPGMRLSCQIKAMRENDTATLREMAAEEKAVTDVLNETTNTDGQYLVPAITDASIRELIPTHSQALGLCTVIPMSTGNPVNMPKMTTGVSGNWVGEQGAATPELTVFGVDTLTPAKWVGLVPLSNELLQDANPAIGDFLIRQMAIGEGVAIDTKVFQNGNTTFTGVFYVSNNFGKAELTSTTAPSSLTYANLLNAMFGCDMNYNVLPAWHFSRSVAAVVMSLLDSNSRPLFDVNSKTLLGYPVNIIEKAPDSSTVASKPIVLFGDLKNSLLGDVAGRSITIAKEGSITVNSGAFSLLENDCTAIRVAKRYAFAPGLVGAYAIVKTAAGT